MMACSALTCGHIVFVYYRHSTLAYLPPNWLEFLRRSEDRLRGYVPLSTFESQQGAGLSSMNFDLEGNMTGDSRAGLDETGVAEIRRIMRGRNVT